MIIHMFFQNFNGLRHFCIGTAYRSIEKNIRKLQVQVGHLHGRTK